MHIQIQFKQDNEDKAIREAFLDTELVDKDKEIEVMLMQIRLATKDIEVVDKDKEEVTTTTIKTTEEDTITRIQSTWTPRETK